MDVQSLAEIIKNQQNAIINLSIHLDSLIEELEENDLLNSDKLDKRMKKKLKKLQAIADKLKQKEEIPSIIYFGGTIGEA